MWKTYIAHYEINELGQLRNSNTGRILKPKQTARGYLQYGISINGKYRDVSAHRAVAELFIPNPEDKPQVNHKDGDKTNNHYTNLEWSTNSENMVHASENELLNNHRAGKRVLQISLDGKVIAEHESLSVAARAVNGATSHISHCCQGHRRTHKGFKWSYIN